MTCPYCHEGLDLSAALACTLCGTPLHGECATLHGRCVSLGCPGTEFGPPGARPQPRRLDPALPASLPRRRTLRAWREAALAPLQDPALFALGLVGLAGLAGICLLSS